jgi:hypothetical protein
MNKADRLKRKLSPKEVEQFASGKKPAENAKVTLHFSFDVDSRLRTYFAGLRAPRGTLSELVEKMVVEGLDARKG